ncbi:hypothetical protein [Peribacillus butanolivorans]|uniref:Uncharacterized protein n=1 Tax=Peribacillus butanolivorans TaxID=421767 RepID=A0ABN5N9G3_9BACI|nr:hypothetical protein [Peribacillus butanolivorans]AXN39809.1 hypothetical protein DTO10_16535 [Peribacillus butanolivorans]
MNKPEYTFSDLVHIAGYGSRIFKIESYRIEQCYAPDEEWSEIVYDLIDTQSGQYVECDEEDMRLADGSSVDEAELDGTGIDIFDFMGGLGNVDINPDIDYSEIYNVNEAIKRVEAEKMAKEPRKPTARELSGQEAERRKQARKDRAKRVDELLDEMNDYKRLVAEFGDEEYKAKVEYLTIKLAEEVE